MDNKDNAKISPEMEDAVNELNAMGNDKPAEPAPAPTPAPAPAATQPTSVTPPAATQQSTPVAPVVNSEPVIADGTSVVEPAAGAAKPKKSKKKVAIISTIAALVVAGGGFGVAYALDNSKDNIALSAMSGLMSQSDKTIAGTIEIVSNVDSSSNSYKNCGGGDVTNGATKCADYIYNPLEEFKVEFKANSDKDAQSSGNVDLSVKYHGKTYKISLGATLIKDNTIYVSIDGLKNAVKNVFDTASVDGIELYQELFNQIASEIDGTWWKINISDIVNSISELDKDEKAKIESAYTCLIDEVKKISTKGSTYADVYKNNAFMTFSEYTGNKKPNSEGTAYSVKLDADKMKSYIDALDKQSLNTGINNCLSQLNVDASEYSSSYNGATTEQQISTITNTINPEIIMTVKNGFFSHELTGIYVEANLGTYTGKANLSFKKLENKIEAPANAKDASVLAKNIAQEVADWTATAECKYILTAYPEYYPLYCDENFHPIENYTIQNNYNI